MSVFGVIQTGQAKNTIVSYLALEFLLLTTKQEFVGVSCPFREKNKIFLRCECYLNTF